MKPCKIYILIKMQNRINVRILKRKNNLLNLILINICKLLSVTFNGARYFLEAVDNYTRKSWIMPLRFRQEVKPILKK
jgi:hypothetical protein